MNYIDLYNAAKARVLSDNATVKIEGTDIEVVKKTYTLEVAKGKKESVTINDPEIIKSIDSINFAKAATDNARYIICKELSRLNERIELIQSMGFKGIDDFAAHMFGFKRDTVGQYARIGKFLITDEYTPVKVLPDNLPVSHMLEMLAYCIDKEKDSVDLKRVATWYADGTLVDGMSTKKVREALKEKYQSLPSLKGDETQPELKEKAKKAKKVNEGTDTSATIIDRLDSITPQEGAAAAIASMDVVEAVLHKYVSEDNYRDQVDRIRILIRGIMG